MLQVRGLLLWAALYQKNSVCQFDVDDYYWIKTDPPFQRSYSIKNRIDRLNEDLIDEAGWILSGSLCSWGNGLFPLYIGDIYVPRQRATITASSYRVKRWRKDTSGGDQCETYQAFMTWANLYEHGKRQPVVEIYMKSGLKPSPVRY